MNTNKPDFENKNKEMNIKISVVICTWNRAESLKRTLDSIKSMYVPNDLKWELIIVDNNSTDNTKEIVEEYKMKSELNIVYVFEEKRGLANARNKGIKEARGEIISFMDDDIIVERNWLINILKAFEIYNPAVLGSRVLIKSELPLPKWFSKNVSDPLGVFDRGNNIIIADNNYNGLIGIGANMSFKREVFNKVGFFRTDLGRKGNKLYMGEETELYWRIKNIGEKCMYYPFAVVYHCVDSKRMSKNYIRRWFFRLGEWNYFSDMIQQRNVNTSVFGIPIRRFKRLFRNLLGLFWYALKNSKAEAFAREVSIIFFFGYCTKRLKSIFNRN